MIVVCFKNLFKIFSSRQYEMLAAMSPNGVTTSATAGGPDARSSNIATTLNHSALPASGASSLLPQNINDKSPRPNRQKLNSNNPDSLGVGSPKASDKDSLPRISSAKRLKLLVQHAQNVNSDAMLESLLKNH